MKVGVCEATELKKRSKELAIPFADLLWGYVIEEMMFRIYDSVYGASLWLETFPVLGSAAYRERKRKIIHFYYKESEKALPEGELCPGQPLTEELAEHMIREIFGTENIWQIRWRWMIEPEDESICVRFQATHHEMDVPVTLVIRPLREADAVPGTRQDSLPALGGRQITYPVYAPENRLCREAFVILDRLELIGDMKSYYNVYQILRSQSLSGRQVMDEMRTLVEASPRVKKEQRLTQLAGYRSYAYMRKRWEKYLRNHELEAVPWEEALDLILAFLTPIWTSLCNDIMFFDNWMPEIGRFI